MLLYIHIPFCDSKCGYCSFNSLVTSKEFHKPYFDSLKTQFFYMMQKYHQPQFETLFIGGGTPNLVDSALYEQLFAFIAPYIQDNAEISIEANPNSLYQSWAEHLKELGVNRISLGAQSFNKKKLHWLQRTHCPTSVIKSIEMLHAIGWHNINIDIIYGTPFDDRDNIIFEIENIKSLPLTHLCAYALTIEEDSKFFEQNKSLNDNIQEMYNHIQSLGFMQYEVSNYTKCNAYCKHNLGYWQHKEYIGIGSGAVSFVNSQRLVSTKHLNEYIKNPLQQDKEDITEEQLYLEKLFLGLRSNKVGVSKNIIKNKENLYLALQEQLVYEKQQKIYASNLFLADELALFLE